jgi:uncharacterized protein YdeI (YjbR/CyaY-like superfamily)
MEALNSTAQLVFTDAAQWDSWLAEHHAASSGVWLRIGKKGSRATSVTIGDALDVALCYGWIDSQRKSQDAIYYLQRYSPRRAKSPWSRLNVERAQALIDAGRMKEQGLVEVAAAKADGRWAAAYAPQRNVLAPADLTAALERNERARAAFEGLDKSARYAVLLPLLKATTPAARGRRLRKAIAALEVRCGS